MVSEEILQVWEDYYRLRLKKSYAIEFVTPLLMIEHLRQSRADILKLRKESTEINELLSISLKNLKNG